MAIYSQGTSTTITTITSPALDILAGSANSPRMMEFGICLGAAGTASTYGLGRPGNDGSQTQTSGVAVVPENPNDPTSGNTKTAVAWGTAPTVPATFARRIYLPGTVGAGIVWTFPRGFIMATSHGVVLWNITANSALTAIWVIVDE